MRKSLKLETMQLMQKADRQTTSVILLGGSVKEIKKHISSTDQFWLQIIYINDAIECVHCSAALIQKCINFLR